MSRSWQDLCVTSATRSLDDFDTINYCTTGILVFFFVATGLACGCRYWQWRRLSSATKAELWELYGVFCALGSLGCAAGVVACLCLMLGNKFAYRTARTLMLTPAYFRNLAQFEILYSVYTMFYALQLTCIGLAKLAVLDRLLNFIRTVFSADERKSLQLLQRRFLVLFVSLNAVGVAASSSAIILHAGCCCWNCRCAACNARRTVCWQSRMTRDGAAAQVVNTSQARALAVDQLRNQDQAAFAVGLQMWAEVVVLLLAIAAFLFLGSLVARRLRAANKVLDATVDSTPIRSTRAAGLQLERQIIATVSVVFFTYIIRVAFSLMNAWAWMAPELTENLPAGCQVEDQCNACQTDRFYMKIWLFNTPQVNAVTVFLSSPVALAVSLYGMTSSKILHALTFPASDSTVALLTPSSSSSSILSLGERAAVSDGNVSAGSSGCSTPTKASAKGFRMQRTTAQFE